nr:MAG TPA: hypothetical protein [Caudoviricetes sp.]
MVCRSYNLTNSRNRVKVSRPKFFPFLLPTCKRVIILTFLQTGGRVCYS